MDIDRVIIVRYKEDISRQLSSIPEDVEVFIYNTGPRLDGVNGIRGKIINIDNLGPAYAFRRGLIDAKKDGVRFVVVGEGDAMPLEGYWDKIRDIPENYDVVFFKTRETHDYGVWRYSVLNAQRISYRYFPISEFGILMEDWAFMKALILNYRTLLHGRISS